MDVAIRLENLSKRYRVPVDRVQAPYRTLREEIMHSLASPWRWLRRDRATDAENYYWALSDVSFTVAQGEVLGVIGRNGAGKSTLLKILSRITRPTKGRAEIAGRVGSLLEVGAGFHAELTGRENIFLYGAVLGMSRREIIRKFDEIVAFAEITRFLDTPVKRFSSGMYMRLAFAVAAHLEPEILLVDEVLAVGDQQFQEKCLGKMRDTSKSGRTVVFVSHNMAAVQHLCTRAILLDAGRITGDGPATDIVSQYFFHVNRAQSVDLTNWPDRDTNGEVTITQLAIFANSKPTERLGFGQTARFVITADFHRPIVDPCFGLLIHTAIGEPLLDIRSRHEGFRAGRVEGRVTVELEVDALSLYPGEYLLSPWVSDDAVRENLDWVKHCCSVRLEPAPGPHGDLKLDPAYGRYHIPSRWTISNQDNG